MAFPTIADADTKNGVVTTNSTSWTLTYPTNIAADDLLLLFLSADGTGGVLNNATGLPAGWVHTNVAAGANGLSWGKKKAVGSETGTFTATLDASESGGWRIFRVPASTWEGTLGTNFGNDANSGAAEATAATGVSANPDPPGHNSFNWDVEDTLWLAVIGVDTSRTISVYPYATRNSADISGGSGGATLGICTTTSAVASINPATYTISASDDWAALTVAVRPAAAVPDTRVPYRNQMPPLIAQ